MHIFVSYSMIEQNFYSMIEQNSSEVVTYLLQKLENIFATFRIFHWSQVMKSAVRTESVSKRK